MLMGSLILVQLTDFAVNEETADSSSAGRLPGVTQSAIIEA